MPTMVTIFPATFSAIWRIGPWNPDSLYGTRFFSLILAFAKPRSFVTIVTPRVPGESLFTESFSVRSGRP
jgi:hypothetical protein